MDDFIPGDAFGGFGDSSKKETQEEAFAFPSDAFGGSKKEDNAFTLPSNAFGGSNNEDVIPSNMFGGSSNDNNAFGDAFGSALNGNGKRNREEEVYEEEKIEIAEPISYTKKEITVDQSKIDKLKEMYKQMAQDSSDEDESPKIKKKRGKAVKAVKKVSPKKAPEPVQKRDYQNITTESLKKLKSLLEKY